MSKLETVQAPCNMIISNAKENKIFKNVYASLIHTYGHLELGIVLDYDIDMSFFENWIELIREEIVYKKNIELKWEKSSWKCLGCFIIQIHNTVKYNTEEKVYKIRFATDDIKKIK